MEVSMSWIGQWGLLKYTCTLSNEQTDPDCLAETTAGYADMPTFVDLWARHTIHRSPCFKIGLVILAWVYP